MAGFNILPDILFPNLQLFSIIPFNTFVILQHMWMSIQHFLQFSSIVRFYMADSVQRTQSLTLYRLRSRMTKFERFASLGRRDGFPQLFGGKLCLHLDWIGHVVCNSLFILQQWYIAQNGKQKLICLSIDCLNKMVKFHHCILCTFFILLSAVWLSGVHFLQFIILLLNMPL